MEITTGWLMVLLASLATAVILVAPVVTALSRFKKANIGMDVVEFFTRLITGKGFTELGPEALHNRLKTRGRGALLVDLRDPRNFGSGHIDGVIRRPFDDFLKEIIAEGRFREYREKDVVLICDTGHMSRVAGEVLGQELGFRKVFSLRGGMKRWWKWNAAQAPRPRPLCGPFPPLPRRC